MALFNRRKADPASSTAPTTNGRGADLSHQARESVFTALGSRLGNEYEVMIRTDFQGHLDDPEHGLDLAYACLIGKLVDIIDALDDITMGRTPTARSTTAPSTTNGVSPFTVYRKDA